MTGIGLNIDGLYLDYDEEQRLIEYLKVASPDYSLVLNSVNKAIFLRQYVKKNIIYRHMFSPEYDNIWKVVTPEMWWNTNYLARQNGLILHTCNEPSITQETIDFEYACGKIAHDNKQEAVLINFSVGVPEERDYPKFDKVFELICNSPYLYLGIHEYAASSFYLEFDENNHWDISKWNKRKDGYIIGRYNRILDYCLKRFGKKPKIILTEFGFDTIHAILDKQRSLEYFSHPMGITNTLEVYKRRGYNAEEYAGEQLRAAWKNFYADEDAIKGACFFCYGGLGDWKVFYNLHRYQVLQGKLTSGFEKRKVETVIKYGSVPTKIRYTGTTFNIRSTPSISGSILSKTTKDEIYYIFEDSSASADSYQWKRIMYNSVSTGLQFGWCAVSSSGFSYDVIDDVTVDLTTEILLAQELYQKLLKKR